MSLTESERATAMDRVQQIDILFENASGWGGWMVMCANEREALVNKLRADGTMIGHKYLARASNATPVD